MRNRIIFPFTFTLNSERIHTLARTMAAGILSVFFICGGISGCENGEDIVTETETEPEPAVLVNSDYDGKSIYFQEGATFYEGRVIEGVSEDEVLVRLADGSEHTISVDEIGGTLIPNHPDEEEDVILLGNRDKGEETVSGGIVAVYTDGMRKIEVGTVIFIDNTFKRLDVPRIRFVHEDADFKKDGGYLTREEFARLVGN